MFTTLVKICSCSLTGEIIPNKMLFLTLYKMSCNQINEKVEYLIYRSVHFGDIFYTVFEWRLSIRQKNKYKGFSKRQLDLVPP